MTYSTSSSSSRAASRAAWYAASAARITFAPVEVMARPTMSPPSSTITALVCVEPTSTPAAYAMVPPPPRSAAARRGELPARCQALEERVDPVLELRLGDHPPVHHVGLDEQARDVAHRH